MEAVLPLQVQVALRVIGLLTPEHRRLLARHVSVADVKLDVDNDGVSFSLTVSLGKTVAFIPGVVSHICYRPNVGLVLSDANRTIRLWLNGCCDVDADGISVVFDLPTILLILDEMSARFHGNEDVLRHIDLYRGDVCRWMGHHTQWTEHHT